MNNLIRPALYGAFHNIIPVELSKEKKLNPMILLVLFVRQVMFLEKMLKRKSSRKMI